MALPSLIAAANARKQANQFTMETSEGLGAVKGANCTVKSIEHDDVRKGNLLTFEWTSTDGLQTKQYSTMFVKDGVDGKINENEISSIVNNVISVTADAEAWTSEDTPIGTVISFMGNTPPRHYLACDGSEYNIEDYKKLADFINEEFGKYNFFGGDGITTFAVPDLRGEFLRGTGTNGHAEQGSGEEVGEHQDATKHLAIYTYGDAFNVGTNGASKTYVGVAKADSMSYGSYGHTRVNATSATTSKPQNLYTSRPTNTSVNYCIKYEGTHYVQVVNRNYNVKVDAGELQIEYAGNSGFASGVIYSLDERCIGSWINGKPLYQKTITGITASKQGWVGIPTSDIGISNIDFGRVVNGFISPKGFNGSSAYSTPSAISTTGHITYQMQIRADKTESVLSIYSSSEILAANYTHTVVIEYTKDTDAENSFTPDMLSGYVKMEDIVANMTITSGDEPVPEYEKVTNHKLLYFTGNEFISVTGGLSVLSSSGSGSVSADMNGIHVDSADISHIVKTNSPVSLADRYSKLFVLNDFLGAPLPVTEDNHNKLALVKDFSNATAWEENMTVIADSDFYYQGHASVNQLDYLDISSVTETEAYVALNLCNMTGKIKAIGFVNDDNIEPLLNIIGETGKTIEEVVSDGSIMFKIANSAHAMTYIQKKCSGTFMLACIGNSTAISFLKASPYYYDLIDDDDWYNFLRLA